MTRQTGMRGTRAPGESPTVGPRGRLARVGRAGGAATTISAALAMLVTSCHQPGGAVPGPSTSVASAGPTAAVATTPITAPITAPTTAPATAPATVTTVADPVRLSFQAAQDRWRARGVATYEHTIVDTCYCAPYATARVLGGRQLGQPARRIDDWFAVIDAELSTADAIDVEFDDEIGLPLRLFVNPRDDVDGDEYGFETVDFRAVADPIARWFTESWGCGRQFVVTTPEQGAALVLRLADSVQPAGLVDVAELATAQLRFGSDLMADQCDDVIEPDEPTPHADDTWTVIEGELDVTAESEDRVAARANGLVAATADGRRVELGAASLENDAWGAARAG